MFLKVDTNGNIFQRREIAGWSKANTPHAANLVYIDATMIYDGSILAISSANQQLHLLATPGGPAEDMNLVLPSPPHAVTTLLDGSVIALTTAGTLHRAEFARGPWALVPGPAGPNPIDVTVTPDGRLLCLTVGGVIQQAPAPGVPGPGAQWAPMAAPPPALANIRRLEYLRNGSLIGIDNGNTAFLSPRDPAGVLGAWQQLQDFGQVLAVAPLGGHTLLGIDPADNRLMTADALPENWVQVPGPGGGLTVLALAHLPTGRVAALCSDQLVRQVPFTPPAVVGGPWQFGAWAQLIGTAPPVPPIGMTANRGGLIVVVGNDHQLYSWTPGNQFQPVGQWSLLQTGPTRLCSVTFLEDGQTLYGIGQNQNERYVCRANPDTPVAQTAWRRLPDSPVALSCASRIKDVSILEVEAANGALHHRPGFQAASSSYGWAGPCRQVIELSTDPRDTVPRARKWLLQYSFPAPGTQFSDGRPYADGRPWGDGTRMAARAQALNDYYPWDAGNRVTPLIGGFAALSAMRDAFEAAIAEASASAQPPGQRGYVYIADWLLNPLRDLSEDNPWGGAAWVLPVAATRDQTAIGLIARMMSAGIKVRVLVWMPTTVQSAQVRPHARQHWHLARMVQELNATLKAQGPLWANVDCGIVALDLRTAPVTAVSLHQKMCVVRVGAVNVGFCGGTDLAYTRRDFRRPANGITGLGDWQSGTAMPEVSSDWPKAAAPASGYPQIIQRVNEDVIPDELGQGVYGVARRWHDQHLKVEGPIVTSLEAQFDERWRLPGRPFLFASDSSTGFDDQVQFTSAAAFLGNVIQALDVTPCDPVGSAVVQLWRTIPVDKRRRARTPFGRGEFTVMAGIANAVQQATQLITIWDQYFWSEPLARLLAARLNQATDLKVLVVLPPSGSSDPPTELWYRKRAVQTFWSTLSSSARTRVAVLNLWSAQHNVGVYVHAKVQTYDDCLLVCGSANMNRRSFTLDMELDLAVAHKPDVWYHLANLAHMMSGQPWLDGEYGWLQRYWAFITNPVNLAQTAVLDPFFCAPGQIRAPATPNGIAYAPNAGILPESVVEPTSVDPGVEDPDLVAFKNAPGTAGRLDQVVWFLEQYYDDKTRDFPFRYPS